MTVFAFLGALELGLIYGLVGIAVFLTFRVLDFPDLTVDGSLPLGSAVAATLIVSGGIGAMAPWVGLVAAFLAGACAGLITAFLAIRFNILNLLASILTMIAAYSINIRIMGRPNLPVLGEETIISQTAPAFAAMDVGQDFARVLLVLAVVAVAAWLIIRLLASDFGLAMRATGQNSRFVLANGGSSALCTYVGLAVSNGLVAMAGAIFTQLNGFADVNAGVGTIVVGLAAVILGETLVGSRKIWVLIVACIMGSILYRIAMAFALNTSSLGLQASDLNLVTAVIVALALVAPKMRKSGFKAPRPRLSLQKKVPAK
ncbi:ABC transporter permease [Tranquillimonas alkanivorans]|uniref:Putative ABC transport system permease protein n=1 Tax=Tranquillimonas alkanivorans TaxID=441119 RepID=A0A1I5S6Q7_9RHOB|nr:ABC transporter permease [Tranquillimonas alkanivorans]SFP66389.1 putative ABC transport system permease protein [Tranquillimonas alkanivorans]